MGDPARKRFIVRATAGYAALAAVWILFSDQMLLALTDLHAIAWMSTLKGFAFVAVTSLLLYLALDTVPGREGLARPVVAAAPAPISIADRWPRWLVYAIAIAVTLAVLALRMLFGGVLGGHPLLILFLVPIILSALLGGGGPGLVSTLIAAVGVGWMVVLPLATPHITLPGDFAQWLMLIANGTLVSVMSEALHRARRQTDASQDGLRRERDLLSAIGRLRSAYIGNRSADEVFAGALHEILALTASRYGVIMEARHDGEGRPYQQCLAISGLDWSEATTRFYAERGAPAGLRVESEEALFSACVASAAPVIANEPGGHADVNGFLPPGHPPIVSFLGLPLRHGGDIVGSVSLANRPGGYDAALADYLAPVAESCAEIVVAYRDKRALAESETRANLILDTAPEGMLVADGGGDIVRANTHAGVLFGVEAAELLGQPVELFLPYCLPGPGAAPHAAARPAPRELVARRHDGTEFPVEIKLGPVSIAGRPHLIVSVADISERKRADDELRVSAVALESRDGIVITDGAMVIRKVNRAFTEITGFSAEEAIGRTPAIVQSGLQDQLFYDAMWSAIGQHGHWQGEIWNRRKNGELYPEWLSISVVRDAGGRATHYVGAFQDISMQKQAEEEIRHLAFYDPLTRLPNRRLLIDRLRGALTASARSRSCGAVLFIDLDNFKILNDTLGHDSGDVLLTEVAVRLQSCVRSIDTVARLGGDEFIVMLEELGTTTGEAATAAEAIGHKLLSSVALPYDLAGREYRITPSIGITLFRDHGASTDEVLKWADLAMYQAKAAGRNTIRFFDPAMQASVEAHAAIESDLHRGIRDDEFVLHYQPKFDHRGRVTGVEALVRWRHPQRGLVSPAEFIPIAEETGLILIIGYRILQDACTRLATWQQLPAAAGLTVAVNVSARQFRNPVFVDEVRGLIGTTGADPRRLVLEITESLFVQDIEDIKAKMRALKELGVTFSLDDFGTGYSSLAYLKRLPFDQVKIDRSFVRDILTDANDAAIVRAIIAMSRSLGLRLVAEGVETEAQWAFLREEGCHEGQGYLWSHPLPPAELERLWLTRQERPTGPPAP